MNATDWATVASLAAALGTLVLAVATFSAIRAANVMARVAQQSMLAGAAAGADGRPAGRPGAVGAVGTDGQETNGAPVYLAVALRNAGNGIAVLHGWRFYPGWQGAFRNPEDPRGGGDDGWLASQSRHWNVDRPIPGVPGRPERLRLTGNPQPRVVTSGQLWSLCLWCDRTLSITIRSRC